LCLEKLIDNMYSRLKSSKVINIFLNGCIYIDYAVYLKTFKKCQFLEKNIISVALDKKKFVLTKSDFFYKKYRN